MWYIYKCLVHGEFELKRSMAEVADPAYCPKCANDPLLEKAAKEIPCERVYKDMAFRYIPGLGDLG